MHNNFAQNFVLELVRLTKIPEKRLNTLKNWMSKQNYILQEQIFLTQSKHYKKIKGILNTSKSKESNESKNTIYQDKEGLIRVASYYLSINEFFSTSKNIHRKDKNYSLQSKSKDTLIELTKYIKENRKESAEEILLFNRDFIVIALEKNLGSRRISEALKQSRGIYISHTSINDFIHRYNLRDKKSIKL